MPKWDVDLLTTEEVRALAATPSMKSPTGIRNRALVLLLASSGIRIGELLAVRPKDVELTQRTVRVQRGKGDKHRLAPIATVDAVDAIARWLDRRKSLGIGGRSPVFCTLQGRSIHTSYVRALLPRLAERAGIPKRVHPHGLRHYFAATLAQVGTPLPAIQVALGHASLAVTSVYLARIHPQEHLDAAFGGMAKAWGALGD